MFCPKCGKELPDGAKFCPQCGTAILSKPQQPSDLEPSTFIQDHNESQQGSAILPKRNSNSWKVIMGTIAAIIILIAVIFIVRVNNEQNMIRQIPWLICDDETRDTITSYYEDYLGKNLTVGSDAEDFSIKQGLDSNSFDIVGKIEVTDISQDNRPTYDVNVTGTATTNFFRTKCSLSYQLQYQTPELSNDYPDPNAYAQPNKGLPNDSTNDFPPTLPPIDPNDPNADLYSRYFGLYVNKEGYALEVGMGSDMYSSYYARIYQSLSDARNYAEPLLEVSGGEAEYGSQGMDIAFRDVQGEIYLFREDDLDENNLTFDLSLSDTYYGGVNVSGYFQSTYYMIERGINVMG